MITFKFILLFDVLNLALIILKFIGYNLISAFSACLNSMIAISSVCVHFFFMSLINNNLVLIYFRSSCLCPSCFTQPQNLKIISFNIFSYVDWFPCLINTQFSHSNYQIQQVPLLSFLPTFTMQQHRFGFELWSSA